MADLLTQLAAWFESLVLVVGYPGIFLGMFAENLFPPVPTDPLLPFAGILAAQGYMAFLLVWAAALSGATVGSLTLYAIGRYGGEPLVRQVVRRWGRWVGVEEPELDRALALFARYGALAVFVGRMTPVLRSGVSLVAGMSRMHLLAFIPATASSSGIVTLAWISVGYFLGENWQEVLTVVSQIPLPVWIGLGAVLAVVLGVGGLVWMRRRRMAPPVAVEEQASSGG